MADSVSPGVLPVVGRLAWIMVGPLALILMTFAIVTEGGGWLTLFDVVFFLTVAAMLVGRLLEFRGGDPKTATGEPATRQHLRRFTLAACVVAPLIWVVANVLGNHVLAS